MRFLKFLTVFVLLVSMLSLTACASGDPTGTAVVVPQPENSDESGGEEPEGTSESDATAKSELMPEPALTAEPQRPATPSEAVELPPSAAVDTVANIVTSLEGAGMTAAKWADIAAAAAAAPDGTEAVMNIENAFVAVANGHLEVPGCDADCVTIVNGLLGGQSTPVTDISDLLEKFSGDM